MAKDQQGLSLAGAPASAEAFDRAVADYYGLTGDPVGKLKARARDAIPAFALGGVAIAGLFMIGGFRGDHPEVTGALGRGASGDRRRVARASSAISRAVEAWAAGRTVRGGGGLGGYPRRPSDRRAGAALRP